VSVSVTIEERDEVYQAVEEFLADISKHHEFNNLLATTVVGSNLQQRRIQDEGQINSTVKYTPGNNNTS
jgi:signal transduction histidine kinase